MKWDGVVRRLFIFFEYIQMVGRVGCCGFDDCGIVIMMVDDKLDFDIVKFVVVGYQDCFNLVFYFGYNMIFNLLCIEVIFFEFMFERCFFQFQNVVSVFQLEKEFIVL